MLLPFIDAPHSTHRPSAQQVDAPNEDRGLRQHHANGQETQNLGQEGLRGYICMYKHVHVLCVVQVRRGFSDQGNQ